MHDDDPSQGDPYLEAAKGPGVRIGKAREDSPGCGEEGEDAKDEEGRNP
jgi:hypothetical protein